MVRKGKLAVLEVAISPKPKKSRPPKIGAHAYLINLYMHDLFEPIPID